MRIGIPKEIYKGETRVGATPDVVERMIKLGYDVSIEKDAGKSAGFSDADYKQAGATIAASAANIWDESDIIAKVRAPETKTELPKLGKNQTLISFFWPAQNEAMLKIAAVNGANVLAMDSVPRISRAQKLDVLSSMSNIGGYRAVIEASHDFGRFLGGQITAAGKIHPAKVLVIGAGVAGLAAIGAASSMGAIVRAFDTRPEVKEQVESMNAEFLMLEFDEESGSGDGYAKTMSKEFIDAEMALFAEQAKDVDIIITTALIPGRPAPELITKEMVESMKPGSVIVDMAAEQGGNCAYTTANRKKTVKGVKIIGYTDLAGRMPGQASQLYGTNVYNLLAEITPEKNGQLVIDMDDEMIRGLTVVNEGNITWPPPPIKVSAVPTPKPAAKPLSEPAEQAKKASPWSTLGGMAVVAALLLGVGSVAPADFMSHFTVFVLACFVGWQVVWNVTPALHTPLMSVTNAISGIIVIGALLQLDAPSSLAIWLSAFAILIASINIAGGFLVTQRMLKMFQK
ncbi:MAG: Re/Si-specific NAD(P)(+) transhydrogenase subunit alpha [Proteobacteria bacterium]|nr:Re/Si-specific NAD(P)(+) transhydrogenase subunit alpha [Pseudomonadota bacterium]